MRFMILHTFLRSQICNNSFPRMCPQKFVKIPITFIRKDIHVLAFSLSDTQKEINKNDEKQYL